MESVISLKTFPAFLVVVGGLAFAGLLGALVPDRFSFAVMNATAALIYLGWPYIVGMVTARHAGLQGSRVRAIASISFPYVVIFHIIAGILVMDGIDRLAGSIWSAFLLFWVLAVAATFYLLWFGASALVAAEQRSPVRLDQYFGTFLEFLLLPIGVLFLQRRVRALYSVRETG